jgi:hypothetical protein
VVFPISSIAGDYSNTLWETYKKLLNMAIEIVDLSSIEMVMFHSYVYQRVVLL